jgi:L-amino acid N-acyltransferase YncA
VKNESNIESRSDLTKRWEIREIYYISIEKLLVSSSYTPHYGILKSFTMSFHIRPAVGPEMDYVTSLYNSYVAESVATFETNLVTVNEMDSRRRNLLNQGYPYLVAVNSKHEIVGFAYASSYRPRAAYRDSVECSIYVNEIHFRKGIGSALLQELIRICENTGYRQMVAVVGGSDNDASIRLHKRHGFRVVGTLESVGYKLGRWVDTVILQRSLGPGNSTLPNRSD